MKMTRKPFSRVAIAIISVVMLTTCYKRDFIYDVVSQYVVHCDIKADNVLYLMPSNLGRMQLSLYDLNTEKEVYRTFLDPSGGYLAGVEPGTYKIGVWSMNSDVTAVTYANRYDLLTAESKVLEKSPSTVVLAPDHVFAYACDSFVIPHLTIDDEFMFDLPLRSVIDTWRIEVDGVKGLTNLAGATFLIGSQAREIYFKDWRLNETATVSASGFIPSARNAADSLIVSEFGTFGMLETAPVKINVSITDRNHTTYQTEVDVTDQVRDTSNTRHIIKIHFEAELKPLEQGGLQPTTEEWDENEQNIDLM